MTTYLGYARVSTEAQSLQMQLAAITPLCGDLIWHEKKSGMTQASRTELVAVVAEARRLRSLKQDVCIVVYSLSRLGRRLVETISLIEDLQKAGIGFKSTSENIDTSSAMGVAFMGMLAVLGQMEAQIISERTIAGLQATRANGVTLGRPRVQANESVETAKQLIAQGKSVREAAKQVGLSNSTLLRLLKTAA